MAQDIFVFLILVLIIGGIIYLYKRSDKTSPEYSDRPSSNPGSRQTFKGIRDVWILAEPFSDFASQTWAATRIYPPESLISQADQALELGGLLIEFVSSSMRNISIRELVSGGNIPVKKVNRMSDEQMETYINKQSGTNNWSRFFARTEQIKYSVVVFW